MTTSTLPAQVSAPARVGRIALIDVLRGVAIIAAVGYHLTWDLGSLDFIGVDISHTGWGRNIAHGIAVSFLFLVGVSLVLAHGSGVRWRGLRRRQLELAAYAAVISLATYLTYPSQVVTFGILHSILISTLLALPFLRAPRVLTLGVAAAAIALPQLVTIPGSSRWWSWTGLTEAVHPTVDHAPLLPWIAATLIGVVVMRTALGTSWLTTVSAWRADRGFGAALAFLGRHTLVIYVLHQPVLLGVLNLVRWLL